MSERIVGYVLLTIGLIVIVISGLNVYQVFTSRALPVDLFHFPGIVLDLGALGKQEIFPASVLNQSSNVAAHLFLMGFIVSVGYRIGSLGIQLLRPIKVSLKDGNAIASPAVVKPA